MTRAGVCSMVYPEDASFLHLTPLPVCHGSAYDHVTVRPPNRPKERKAQARQVTGYDRLVRVRAIDIGEADCVEQRMLRASLNATRDYSKMTRARLGLAPLSPKKALPQKEAKRGVPLALIENRQTQQIRKKAEENDRPPSKS